MTEPARGELLEDAVGDALGEAAGASAASGGSWTRAQIWDRPLRAQALL